MIRGPDFLIPDLSLIHAINAAHPAATSLLIAGQWVTVPMPAEQVIAQYDAAKKPTRTGFGP